MVNRLVYGANNVRQLDTGSSEQFGDVGLVFKTERLRGTIELFPLDSGVWEASCNKSLHFGHRRPATNLSCSSPPAGTLSAFDHIILTSIQMWGGLNASDHAWQVAELLGRTALSRDYTALPSTSRSDQFKFYESNILGNPRCPDVYISILPS
jgi:hypothetical protein